MFREGIGVVVEGEYGHDGVFRTDRVMIKHSNEYRAPEPGEAPSEMFSTLVEGEE
jgi:cytochrome c-type biogenesis protein CcmE